MFETKRNSNSRQLKSHLRNQRASPVTPQPKKQEGVYPGLKTQSGGAAHLLRKQT